MRKTRNKNAHLLPPPFPIIPQIWKMLNPAYTCDLCQKVISEEQYDHHDGLCEECANK